MRDQLRQDIRYAARGLGKSPGFCAVAVLTIGLGIGVNTAVFSVANAVLLQPLPYAAPDRLVFVRGELRNRDVFNWPISPRILLDMRERSTLIEAFAGLFSNRNTLIGGDGDPVQVQIGNVTPNFFSLLGVLPAIGRDFEAVDAAPIAEDTDPGSVPPGVAILSDRLWRSRFGGDPSVVGGTARLGGGTIEIIGVLPADFSLLLPADSRNAGAVDLWTTPRIDLVNADRRSAAFEVIGRLSADESAIQAQAEIDAVVGFLHEVNEALRGAGYNLRVTQMHQDVTAQVRPVVLALLGAVGFVLLIACANVSNLLMVRASTRRGEIAVRSALGGSRWRLVRQMLTESLMLVSLGAATGLVLALAGIEALIAMGPPEFPRMDAIGVDGSVLIFTVAISVTSALVFGMLPALHGTRGREAEVLKDRGRSALLAGRGTFRNGVIVVEVALSVVLLIGAGLMLRSFIALQRADPGFQVENALTFEVQLTGEQYARDRRIAFVDELRNRLAGLPGVEVVSAANALPLHGPTAIGRYGTTAALEDDSLYGQADYRYEHLDYFRAMGTRLVAGRTFGPSDFDGDGAAVVVIDELVAARLWPGEVAVGKTLVYRSGPEPERAEVIGVVEHQRAMNPAIDGKETVHFNARHAGDPRTLQWIVRTAGDPARLAEAVRAQVVAIDASLPVNNMRTMADALSEAVHPTRFALTAIAVFAALALTLAAVGLYAVLAYLVRQRTGEIGLRVAFGAGSASVVSLVLRQVMMPTLVGLAAGGLTAFWLTRFISALLVGVQPTDPATFLATAAVFLAVAATAGIVPTVRALRVDPADALRGE